MYCTRHDSVSTLSAAAALSESRTGRGWLAQRAALGLGRRRTWIQVSPNRSQRPFSVMSRNACALNQSAAGMTKNVSSAFITRTYVDGPDCDTAS
jgi:hypothetical protein